MAHIGQRKGGWESPNRPSRDALLNCLALRELEAASCLGAAVLLALDDARVAGQEAGLLDERAQRGLVAGQRLSDAVLDRAGLAGEAAADDGRDHVILVAALGDIERLVDHEAQRRTREIGFLLATVDDDLARARLQPDARNGVLAAAGRIGTAELVELLLAQRRGLLNGWGSGGCFGRDGGRRFRCGSGSDAELVG